MTRAALRELVANAAPGRWPTYTPVQAKRLADGVLALLDDCDRLERENALLRQGVDFARDTLEVAAEDQDVISRLTKERDEARSLVGRILYAYRRTGATPTLVADMFRAVATWNAEDAQAAKKDGA